MNAFERGCDAGKNEWPVESDGRREMKRPCLEMLGTWTPSSPAVSRSTGCYFQSVLDEISLPKKRIFANWNGIIHRGYDKVKMFVIQMRNCRLILVCGSEVASVMRR